MTPLSYFENFYIQLGFGPAYVVTNLLFCLGVVLVFNASPFYWKTLWKKILDWAVTWLAVVVLSSLYYWIFSDAVYMMFVIWPLLIFAHAFVMNGFTLSERLCRAFVLSSLHVLSLKISAILGAYFLSIGDVASHFFNAGTIIIILLTALNVFFILRFPLSSFKRIHPLFVTLEGVLTGITYVILVVSQSTSMASTTYQFDTLNFVLDFGLYLVCGISYYMLYAITKEQNQRIEAQAVALKQDKDQTMLALSENNLEDLRKIRHDLKNQYGYMKTLLANKDYEQLNRFFTDMSEATMVPLTFVDCGNNTISSVLNFEMGKARNAQIQIENQIIVPKTLKISDVALTSLLGNLLDNAMESLIKEKIPNPVIHDEIFVKENYLVIKVSNPVNDSLNKQDRLSLVTSKEDKEAHGYGTKIVKTIVKENNGYVQYDVQNGFFIAIVMLALCGEEKDDA